MNIWIRRTLQGTLLSAGFLVLGAGAAHADSEPAGLLVRVGVDRPAVDVHVHLGAPRPAAAPVRRAAVRATVAVRPGLRARASLHTRPATAVRAAVTLGHPAAAS